MKNTVKKANFTKRLTATFLYMILALIAILALSREGIAVYATGIDKEYKGIEGVTEELEEQNENKNYTIQEFLAYEQYGYTEYNIFYQDLHNLFVNDDSFEYRPIDTDTVSVSGNIAVICDVDDDDEGEIIEDGEDENNEDEDNDETIAGLLSSDKSAYIKKIYTGSHLPSTLSISYLSADSLEVADLAGYDMYVFEEDAGTAGISDTLFLHLDKMIKENYMIIYNYKLIENTVYSTYRDGSINVLIRDTNTFILDNIQDNTYYQSKGWESKQQKQKVTTVTTWSDLGGTPKDRNTTGKSTFLCNVLRFSNDAYIHINYHVDTDITNPVTGFISGNCVDDALRDIAILDKTYSNREQYVDVINQYKSDMNGNDIDTIKVLPTCKTFLDKRLYSVLSYNIMEEVTSVVIPDSVTSIGQQFFQYCLGLEYIYLNPNVTDIGKYAFECCQNLKEINISNATSIGYGAFRDCRNLEEIDISSATMIDSRAFKDCKSLHTVEFGKNVQLNSEAFSGCESLSEVDFSRFEVIRQGAFSGCPLPIEITIPENVKCLNNAFTNTPVEHITIYSDGMYVAQIGFLDHDNATNIKSVTIWMTDNGITFGHYTIEGLMSAVDKMEWNLHYIDEPHGKQQIYSLSVGDTTFEITDMSIKTLYNKMKEIDNYADLFLKYAGAKEILHHTITFDSDGGLCGMSSIVVNEYDNYKNLPIPTKNGCTFVGWYLPNGVRIQDGDKITITEDTTLVAKWTAEKVDNGSDTTEAPNVGDNTTESGKLDNSTNKDQIIEIPNTNNEIGNSKNIHTVTLVDTKHTIPKEGKIEVQNGKIWDEYLTDYEQADTEDIIQSFDLYEHSIHYIFNGWKTEEGKFINRDDKIELNDDITLYTDFSVTGNGTESKKVKFTFYSYDKIIEVKIGTRLYDYDIPTPVRTGDELLGWTLTYPIKNMKDIFSKDTIIHSDLYQEEELIRLLYPVYQSDVVDKHLITTTEMLSGEPIYRLNRNNIGKVIKYIKENRNDRYALNQLNFNETDKKNADTIKNKILNSNKDKVAILPKGYTVDVEKLKKKGYIVIKTNLELDDYISALTYMNCRYFQYLQLIQTPYFKTESEFNSWNTEKNPVDYKLKVSDFELDGPSCSKGFIYFVEQNKFKEYYTMCSEIETKLIDISKNIGLEGMTVTDALWAINELSINDYAYDNWIQIYDLNWFLQITDEKRNEEKKANYHGVCASYSKLAFALLGLYGYEAIPTAVGNGEYATHSVSKVVVNGKTYYCDYTWAGSDHPERYAFLTTENMVFDAHRKPEPDDMGNKITYNRKSATLSSLKIRSAKNQKSKKLKVTFNKIKNADGYEVQYGTSKKFKTSKKKTVSKTKITIIKLNKNKTYYVRIRPYKNVKLSYIINDNECKYQNIKYYGAWSKIKSVKIKK